MSSTLHYIYNVKYITFKNLFHFIFNVTLPLRCLYNYFMCYLGNRIAQVCCVCQLPNNN